MPAEVVVLLMEEARKYRERATRAREVARLVSTTGVCDNIVRYAGELEQGALVLEGRAVALEKAIARNRDLSVEFQSLIEDRRRHLTDLRARLQPAHSGDPE